MRVTLERAGRPLSWLALSLVLLCHAGAAQARVEQLVWDHPSPGEVAGFRVHRGSSSGSYDTVIDVGLPSQGGDGGFSYALTVPDDATVYVAISAYAADGRVSPPSNERVRSGPTIPDPDPDPDPGDDGSGGGSSGGGSSGGGSGEIGTDPNTVWFEDFESSALGAVIPGWLDTAANNSMSEDDSLFRVSDLGGDRVLSTYSTAINIHSHYVGTGSLGWARYDLLGRMRLGHAAGGIGVTAYSQYDSSDVYYRLRRYSPGGFELTVHPGSDAGHPEFVCPAPQTGVVPTANTWYRFRLRVEDGTGSTRIRAKVWPSSAAEPSAWQAECLDGRSNRPASGRVGVWSMNSGSKYWDDFEVIGLEGGSTGDGGGGDPQLQPPAPPILLD